MGFRSAGIAGLFQRAGLAPFSGSLQLDLDRGVGNRLSYIRSFRAGLGKMLDVCLVWATTPLTMLGQCGLLLSFTEKKGHVSGVFRYR